MKLAIIGATGMVGNVMLKVLEERDFPYTELIVAASPNSVGKALYCKGQAHHCITVEDAIAAKPDIAIFSAGGSSSKKYAPLFAEVGCVVIDNSSAWRMDENVPLVVPEINMDAILPQHKIIANPNCSTIQMVVALAQLHKKFELSRLIVSTYQSVTGTGVKAVEQLFAEREGREASMVYPHPIDLNCLPHGGDFEANGYTSEEMKLYNETRKIYNDYTIETTATVVRVPVVGGHSMSVNAYFSKQFEMKEVMETLANTPGVVVQDNPAKFEYPMPRYSEHKDPVFVGRVRQDFSYPNSINLWIVADNLRKGAATNAIQIAEELLKRA
ncbi:MAG: aspartate-semialdehyde dehydrogenase [Chitinophagales bacterium]|nr:aspartate-semialdehyde dehydrogenase [Bacteroidota bacterium]MCB9256364.1 aspartate-semialdehyde dehydrogenase [Chitinophagales bacterium]